MSSDVKVKREVKRKWNDMEWEVVMEAQTLVAVYAAPPEDADVEGVTNTHKSKKFQSKGKGKASTTRASARATRGSTRSKRGNTKTAVEVEKEDVEMTVTTKATQDDGYWLAQLLDDVTEQMLGLEISVRIRWLNKRENVPNRYDFAYDEQVDVQSILCHVYMNEFEDGSLEITSKSLERVRRSLARAKRELTDEEMEDDDEKPPTSGRKKKRSGMKHEDGDEDGEGGSKRLRHGGGSKKERKLTKREEAMHIPPVYTTVDLNKYEDVEIHGKHPHQPIQDDALAASREVIRAVVIKDHKLLKRLTEDKEIYKWIHSFSTKQSVDVKKTALHFAIDMDDLVAARLLLKAHKIEQSQLAKKPERSLPSHSTGKHTSSYSDYNRRAINASRGGREGNNALMEDSDGGIVQDEVDYLWSSKNSSVKMFTLMYPTGDWTGYSASYSVAKVCRAGNYKLAAKLIETLSRNGGYGFNDLHGKVLSETNEQLPVFRIVSAIKQAYQTKIRPLHLAAINPNTKYLETLWDSAGDEWSTAKDDLAFEPIHFAAACESTAPLKFLLDKRCSLFARTKRRHTPIMRALITERQENAIFIMKHAAEEGEEVLAKLVSERGPMSFQPIHYAAWKGCSRALDHLLKSKADINSVCEGKATALCLAAREGHYECVKILLDHGAKVNVGDKLKKTPLIFAVKNGHTKSAALLINHGANVNAFDTSENSVAHYAAAYGWKSCLELIADAGGELWAKNSWGFVPLTCALLKQRLQCTEYILERDPNKQFLDFRDRDGCTMLYLQCKHSKNIAQIQYLLDKGVDPNIPNSQEEHSLQAIIDRAVDDKKKNEETAQFYVDAVKLLLENGAKANIDIKRTLFRANDMVDRMQPLQLAIQGNEREIFLLLLDKFGADPNRTNSVGSDGWMTAATQGQPGEFFLEALLKNHAEKNPGKTIDLSHCDRDNDNIFHYSTRNDLDKLISPELVRQLIKQCANPAVLFKQKNKDGRTPLQRLLECERSVVSDDMFTKPEHAEAIENIKLMDKRYSDLVLIFAEYATDLESWIVFKDENKLKSSREGNESGPHHNSDVGRDVDGQSDKDKDDENEDDDKNDEDDEDEDESDDDGDDNDKDKGKVGETKLDDVADAELVPVKMIKALSILHLAANKKLTVLSTKLGEKWFGINLVTALLSQIRFDLDTINFPDYVHDKTPLDYAVEHQDVESVRALLTNGANPNHSPNPKNHSENSAHVPTATPSTHLFETSLLVAVRNENVKITELLLDHQADFHCCERTTLNRPLHLALMANNADITKALLSRGADLSKINSRGLTALHIAVSMRHSVPVDEPHEGEITYTDMTTTKPSARSKTSAIAVALQNDRAKYVGVSSDLRKRTPVHLAAANRDIELLRALVNVSVNKEQCVNQPDEFGRTPLHYAVNVSPMTPDASFDIERFLLQSGADPNAADKFLFTPLHFALFKVDFEWHHNYDKSFDKVEAECQREAGTYEQKKQEAFMETISKIPQRETDPVETLSNLVSVRGINTHTQDILGRTPLHLAAATGAFVCASSILAAQTDAKKRVLAITDKDGFTALGRAVENLRQTTIMTLLQSGADVSGFISKKEKETVEDEIKITITRHSYFFHAVMNSLTGICHMLLNAKFSKYQAVEDALRCGQFQLASNLIVGIEMSSNTALLAKSNGRGETLLHALAQVDKPFSDMARAVAWTLIDNGIKPNAKNDKGCSALHFAANLGNIHLMDFLLHNKCDANETNTAGEVPLLYALKHSNLTMDVMSNVLEYFINKKGVNIHVKDKDGMNVLSAVIDRFASSDNSTITSKMYKWVDVLLKKGVDPNGLFTSTYKTDFFKNDRLGKSTETKVPAIIRVVYATSTNLRYPLLGLLLRYKTRVNVADSNPNTLFMHLAAHNMMSELQLVLGKVKTLRDPIDSKSVTLHSIDVPPTDIKQGLAQTNSAGENVLHVTIQPLTYGSYENAVLIDLLITSGANLLVRNNANKTPIDLTTQQTSRFLYRFFRSKYPNVAAKSEHEVFDETMEEWKPKPDFAADAAKYLDDCLKNGKITRTRVHPSPNKNADVGSLKRVFGELDKSTGKVLTGEEYDALLTKVDVKNGMFGLNVFYRCQVVHDCLQDLYIVFTNWGRIGEEGKFQNTPFHAPNEAVAEFKKIFRSKTGNHWHERHQFVKHVKKYNLIQRVNYNTKLNDEITSPFVDLNGTSTSTTVPFAKSTRGFTASVSEMLYAITDVHNLQLAATENCKFDGSLPLANSDELRAAVDKLLDIRTVIEKQKKVDEEMQKVRGDISDEASSRLVELSQQHTTLTEEISEKSSRYYEVMPCDEQTFGRSIKGFDNINDVNAEITRLRQLIDITHTYKMLLGAKLRQTKIHPLDYCYDALQVHLSAMSKDSLEAKMLNQYFLNGVYKGYGDRPNAKISNIFTVSRNGETPRFMEMLKTKPSLTEKHSQLLWHGTRRTNLMGILSQGLRIAPPEAPHHGYLYGKGLYFANVAAKSLAYCDSAYKITSKSVNTAGIESKKDRKVHYLLLCEVALGTPTKVAVGGGSQFGQQEDGTSGIEADSVYAVGKYTPDPTSTVVSSLSGVAVPVGRLGEIGVTFPIPYAWAKTDPTPSPNEYFSRSPKSDADTLMFYDKLANDLVQDQVYNVEENKEKAHFFHWCYETKTITVEMVNKTVASKSIELWNDVTLKITVQNMFQNKPLETFSWQVKRYYNVFLRSELEKDFALVVPQQAEYDELIVYNEDQARIRYLVEVETV